MKKLRTLLVLLLVLATVLALAACGCSSSKKKTTAPGTTAPSGPSTTPTPTTPSPTTPPVTNPPVVEMVNVVKDGKSDYRLISPKRSPAGFGGLSDIGTSLRTYITSNYRITLRILNDAQSVVAGTPEILIGDTNRPESAAVAARLAEMAEENVLYYVVAEMNGQIVLYSNDSRMYETYEDASYKKASFLYDYFIANYTDEDGVAVPKDCFDVQKITVAAYDAYMAEIERQKAEDLEYARQQKIAALKKEVGGFRIADFGRVQDFDSIYSTPEYFPTKGSHPRLFVTEKTLPEVRARFLSAGSRGDYSYRQLLNYVNTEHDGNLPDTPEGTSNYTTTPLAIIESKAFYYLMTGDEIKGYEAILALKNYLLTFEIYSDRGDNCRDFGYIMFVTGLVYDWCHDLLTVGDCNQLIAAVHTRIGPNMEVGFPPSKQGGVTGHGSEMQVLRDYFAFAIACYDERPALYNYVCGRIQDVHVPPINWFGQSGSHWQGTNYGPFRFGCTVMSEVLMTYMSDFTHTLYDTEAMRQIALNFLYYRRPDNQTIYIGDTGNQSVLLNKSSTWALDVFYVACLTGDKTLMANAKLYFGGSSPVFSHGTSCLSEAMYFCVYDPEIFGDYAQTELDATLPLVRYDGSPLGTIFARSEWNDPDAVSVYMKIGEAYSANHEHKDAGNFQIFYKGNLATDSGIYDTYVNPHGAGYYRQSVSSNTLLIFNPSYSNNGNWIYTGGQSIHKSGATAESATLKAWQSKYTASQAEIIGHGYEVAVDASGKEEYIYSYLAGDLTNAYDDDTVDEVSRYMISVMTGDPENPMAFIVYDRITSVDASFKKTFLLHVQEKPIIDDEKNTAIVTNTKANAAFEKIGFVNNGKLYVQSLLSDVKYFMVGGSKGEEVNGVVNETDMQFAIYSRKPIYNYDAVSGTWTKTGGFTELGYHNYPAYEYVSDRYLHTPETGAYDPVEKLGNSTHEYGWGRIEISPAEQNLTDRLLTVMYVTDADNDAPQVMAEEIKNDYFVGAIIFGKAVLFPVNGGAASRELMTFTVDGEGELEYYISGLAAGRWEISVDGTRAGDGIVSEDGILRVSAKAGTVTLKPCFSTVEFDLGGGRLNNGVKLPTGYNYGDTNPLPTADTTGEVNPAVDITKLGSVFLGWYTNPEFTGEPVTAFAADMTGPQTFYAKWNKIFSVVDYEPNGGVINESYDYHLTEGATLIPPKNVTKVVDKITYYFTGWFAEPDCSGKRVDTVTTALANADGDVTLYAGWRRAFVLESFESAISQLPLNSESADQVRNGVSYTVSEMEGASFETLADASGNHYLKWIGGSDASAMYVLGSLAGTLESEEATKLTLALDLARLQDVAATQAVIRLRGSGVAGVQEQSPLLHVGADGKVYLGFGLSTVLTTLDAEFASIAVTVDAAAGTISGYVDGEFVATVELRKPASVGNMTTQAWLESLTKYVVDFSATTPNTDEPAERTLLVDNFSVYIGGYED